MAYRFHARPLPAGFAHSAQAHSARAPKPCGHVRHVGTCAPCQRAQLARWNAQLAAVEQLTARAHQVLEWKR
jgi:hypothetical protein